MRNAALHVPFALAALVASGCCSYSEEAAAPAQPAAIRAETPSAASEQSRLDPNLFVGSWTGRGCQSDGPCWSIRVELSADQDGKPVGTIAYPSVPCSAKLEFVQWEYGDVAAFRERFADRGQCVPDGWLRLRLTSSDTLGFEWAYPDGRVDAGTSLDRER